MSPHERSAPASPAPAWPRRAALALGLGVVVVVAASRLSATPPSPTPPAASSAQAGTLAGLCEASAIVPKADGFLVGDNETEDRLHGLSRGMETAAPRALGAEVEDIEALVALPDGGLLVVGSQGASKKGKRKELRERVLVLGGSVPEATPVRPDLSACGACEAARGRPPKEGGLSVEGAAWWSGALWLGLRSPLVDGQALLLRMEGDPRVSLSVAQVLSVDLGGDAVRDLLVHDGALLLLAGPADDARRPHALYRLGSPGAAPTRLPLELPPGAEGIAVDQADLVVVTDGDGPPGTACKEPAGWVRVPLPPSG